MKRYCTKCEMLTASFDSWCSCREADPGNLSVIFDYGESLGDIEIVRMLRVMKTGALYEAKRKVKNKDQMILLKVAHNACAELIKREAVLLAKLAQAGGHPMLPVISHPYQGVEEKTRPYGKTVFGSETKYYIVYEHAKGDFLRDILIKNAQPWYQHAAWITISLADVVAFTHFKGQQLLLNLSPDTVMVRYDKDNIPRPLLMDLSLAADPSSISVETLLEFAMPAYIAPELLLDGRGGQFGAQTDVYNLGLLLYEMLAGRPAYIYRLRRPEDVLAEIRKNNPPMLNRTDLSGDINMIVHQAIDKSPTRRFEDVRSFAKQLRVKFGEVPVERKGRRIPRQILAAGVALLLILVSWTIFMAVLSPA